jgi:hypothetical protein
MGWASRKNGDLLTIAQGEFDVFLTVDRNLSVQHDVSKFTIAVVVLVAKSNRLVDLRPLVPDLLAVLGAAVPGQVVKVGA